MREKYQTMDSLIRAEFQRKDEAIKTLHNILETQVRALQTAIKQEEMNRASFENLIKGDLLKFQENLRKVYFGPFASKFRILKSLKMIRPPQQRSSQKWLRLKSILVLHLICTFLSKYLIP